MPAVLGAPEQAPLFFPAGCQAQSLDLIFLLDASASVGPENFAHMQSFLRSCTLQFDVNPDVTQVGLVVYGSWVQVVFELDTHMTRAAVLRAMSQAPYLGGVGSAGTALLHIHDHVMTIRRGARPGVPKAVVMLTGGRGVEDAAVPAQKLRDNGVSILVVGMGPVLREALRRLAGPRDSLIHVAAYTDLRYHQDMIIEWICAGEGDSWHLSEPPSVPKCRPSLCVHGARAAAFPSDRVCGPGPVCDCMARTVPISQLRCREWLYELRNFCISLKWEPVLDPLLEALKDPLIDLDSMMPRLPFARDFLSI